MPRGKPFQPGNKFAKGGPRENSGRPTDWLREKCREAGPHVTQFLIDVATGKDMEQVVNDQGETIRVPAQVKDRIRATEIILDRGYGKVEQPINVNDGEFTGLSTPALQAFIASLEGGTPGHPQGGTRETTVQ